MVYLIDDEYLFSADTIWLGADGGYSFINKLAEDNNWLLNRLQNLRVFCASVDLIPKLSPGIQAGRMTSTLSLLIPMRCVTSTSQLKFMTPKLPTTHMTSVMTRAKTR